MNLSQAWGINTPTSTKGRVVNMDTRKRYIRIAPRGPEPIPRGTPMPGSMGTLVLKLLGE
jgi:hypothetical protein